MRVFETLLAMPLDYRVRERGCNGWQDSLCPLAKEGRGLTHLCDDDNIAAPPVELLNCLSHLDFALALRVYLGGVKGVDAILKRNCSSETTTDSQNAENRCLSTATPEAPSATLSRSNTSPERRRVDSTPHPNVQSPRRGRQTN